MHKIFFEFRETHSTYFCYLQSTVILSAGGNTVSFDFPGALYGVMNFSLWCSCEVVTCHLLFFHAWALFPAEEDSPHSDG